MKNEECAKITRVGTQRNPREAGGGYKASRTGKISKSMFIQFNIYSKFLSKNSFMIVGTYYAAVFVLTALNMLI